MVEIAQAELPRFATNALRALSMDAVQKANSGHPGMPMGMADLAYAVWSKTLHFNPKNPRWLNRDRFVLSNGHGSMLLYSLLHLTGFDLPLDELKNFRQLHSKTPGHPEYGHTPGVEVTTGPLGQGIANAVGMALAERWLAARFNKPGHELIDHRSYVFAGDGCMEEGVSHGACSLAGHLGLNKLIVFYDDNHISIDGPTSLSFSDDVPKRFAAYGWNSMQIDGHDPAAIAKAIDQAHAEKDRPTLIACRTVIGFGAPTRAGTHKAHGEALGEVEVAGTRKALGWEWPPFVVPQPVLDHWRAIGSKGAGLEAAWNQKVEAYSKAFPAEGKELKRIMEGRSAEGWQSDLAKLHEEWKVKPPDQGSRISSGKVLDTIGMKHGDLLGGSADLTPSNNTKAAGFEDIAKAKFAGKYVRYGVREHGMGAIMNGLALHGGVVPYAGTFAMFSDYMRPAIRLAALSGLQVVFVMTHDSIGLGEDGPTHQPVEHYAALRAIPNLYVFRPADARETLESWKLALEMTKSPSLLLLSRQKVNGMPYSGPDGTAKGGYVLADAPQGTKLDTVLMATGSEIQVAMAARDLLAKDKVCARVVSLPCWELFEQQPEAYRKQVLKPEITSRVAVEAGVSLGWDRYLGPTGTFVGMKGFGYSAPFQKIYEHVGITPEKVAEAAKKGMR